MEAARAVTEQALAEQAGIAKAHARQLQQAEDAVAKARQDYLVVDSKFRRIKSDLATKYEETMEHHETLKRELAGPTPHGGVGVRVEDAAELVRLSASVEQLWDAETTTNEDRKHLLRVAISEIVVHRVSDENADCEIGWVGGLRQRFRVLRPKGVDVLVRRLRETLSKDPATIAKELRAQGVTTAAGTPVTRDAVYASLRRLGLRQKDERRHARGQRLSAAASFRGGRGSRPGPGG
jgi:hypothetical protein